MLQSQVNYWTLQENKRHNKVMEEIEREKTGYQGISAYASQMQAETGRMLVPVEQQKANATTMQAEAAKENVQVNWANAYTNSRNADTNARNADINAYNAETSRFNANINLMNAETAKGQLGVSSRLADIAQFNADTSYSRMVSDKSVNDSVVHLNTQKTQHEFVDTQTAKIDYTFATANNIMSLGESGSKIFKNVADPVIDAYSAFTRHKDNNKSSWNFDLLGGIAGDVFLKVLPQLIG